MNNELLLGQIEPDEFIALSCVIKLYRGWWYKKVNTLVITSKHLFVFSSSKLVECVPIENILALTYSSTNAKDLIIHIDS